MAQAPNQQAWTPEFLRGQCLAHFYFSAILTTCRTPSPPRSTDDCLLYREINTFNDHISLQQDLKQLEAWADTWGMRFKFNASKCHILSINSKSSFRYSLSNTIHKQVPNKRYLSILLSRGPH